MVSHFQRFVTRLSVIAGVIPGPGEIRLVRATDWHIDSPGLTVLGVASGIRFETGTFHTLRVTFTGRAIGVYFDGILVISATDLTYGSGVVALDVSNQPIEFDDVVVIYGALQDLFNSAEPGCDYSDPNVVMCDDFEDGIWYRTNCDSSGVTDPFN